MKKEKKPTAPETQPGNKLPDPGNDRNKRPRLPLTETLKEKLKKIRKQDPNIYPLW